MEHLPQRHDFSKVKIHCSSLGVLFVEPKDATAKKNGDLSATAKTHLVKIYIQEYWKRKRLLSTKQMDKGNMCEPASIEAITIMDDKVYSKNEEIKENEWIIGCPDVVDEFIHDVKSSYDAETFLPMLVEPLEKMYEYQMQGYMWLWNKEKALVRRCLISTPYRIIQDEKRRLLFKMDVATEENPEYKDMAAELEYNLTFEDIPMDERIITHTVNRNEDIIALIPDKVAKARAFLQWFHEKHMALNKSAVCLTT